MIFGVRVGLCVGANDGAAVVGPMVGAAEGEAEVGERDGDMVGGIFWQCNSGPARVPREQVKAGDPGAA